MFACQKDSYLKELETKVISVKRIENEKFFEVELQDTILFPEGGGQNHDTGLIAGHRVFKVVRDGGKAIHHVEQCGDDDPFLEVNQIVQVKVDWDRRFDNMQQHTGQHLLSAILQSQLGLKTNSWWMAENSQLEVGQSYIELSLMEGHKSPTPSELEACEATVNQMIREQLPVTVNAYKAGDPELKRAHSRGLPSDLPSDAIIRIVDIVGDRNMCCGTHVVNLSHLQMIKILQLQKSKKGNELLLYFVAGERVSKLLRNCLERESKMTALLKNRPLDHYSLVEKAMGASKNAKRINSTLLKELAVLEAERVKNMVPVPKYICNYKKEGTPEYTGTFIKELNDANQDIFIFLIVGSGEGGSPFQMTLSGDPQDIKVLGSQIISYLDGKGGGSGSRFNAKVNSLKDYQKAVMAVEEHFKS